MRIASTSLQGSSLDSIATLIDTFQELRWSALDGACEGVGRAAVPFVQATTQLDTLLVCSDGKLWCAEYSTLGHAGRVEAVVCGNPF
mmetsp:Transcript_45140/g.119788  ORF Transcript_45140/g.119788 Transcript_45140/m.119788 type:complete len:87 (-) Transcript_45140:12-272(-)